MENRAIMDLTYYDKRITLNQETNYEGDVTWRKLMMDFTTFLSGLGYVIPDDFWESIGSVE